MNVPSASPIAVKGQHVGVVIIHQLGVQFLARDARVSEMDRSIWPSAKYAERRVPAAQVRALRPR